MSEHLVLGSLPEEDAASPGSDQETQSAAGKLLPHYLSAMPSREEIIRGRDAARKYLEARRNRWPLHPGRPDAVPEIEDMARELRRLHEAGCTDRRLMRIAIAMTWGYGSGSLPPRLWREIFARFGYWELALRNGRPERFSKRATLPMTLYRGAAPECAEGFSWTRSLTLAAYYAVMHGDGRGRVWVTTVTEPGVVYGRLRAGGHEPTEWVLEPEAISVAEYNGPVIKPVL